MAARYRSDRSAATRKPLTEISNRANSSPARARLAVAAAKTAAMSSPAHLPHNESLQPNGSLEVRSSPDPSSPEHARMSTIVADHRDDSSKRNSAVSTASTNASARRRKTYIGHWQLGRTIGKGGCSRVRAVRHKTTSQMGAVKIITRSTAESTRAQSLANLIESTKFSQPAPGYRPIPYGLEREIAVMKLLEHPNIVRLYDVWENRNELYLIMEYVQGGELFHYVDERKGLHEDETVYIFRQIVAALLYCHKLLICHRDLKPENILLDHEYLTVKLIDFGMAALQPEGRLLSTPCGSPHYAAPEVVSNKPYDGKQADVWSCGVILYVMLTGTTPYNYSADGDIRALFRDIGKARYWMPPELSLEAQDLIRRIFVPDPKRRMTMDDVWAHPLLHKYDHHFGWEGPSGSKEAAIGPIPTLKDFKLRRIQDIDREILRNMRTLWHSEPEHGLIQKLLSNEINQEKLFYAALIKHREDNLENYSGVEDMDYSKSDYHHAQTSQQLEPPPVPAVPTQRTQSQYSIMNDEHLRSSPSFVGSPPSMSSYDPYRASKDPMVAAKDEASVVVNRQGSAATRKTTASRSSRQPNPKRIDVLKQAGGGRRISVPSSSSLARSARSRSSMPRSSLSRHSMLSSAMPSSPPVIATMRPSDVHKRGVSFSHLRRMSTASALTNPESEMAPPTPSLPDTFRDLRSLRGNATQPPSSSPPVTPEPARIRSKKVATGVPRLETPRIKVRRPESTSVHIRNDIRMHSAELEKACEEAFFRSSVGSSLTAQTTFSDKIGSDVATPPSSVSARGSGMRELLNAKRNDVPRDTPNTYLTRTLEETREKLAAYKSSEDGNAAKFEEVMRMLENIMPASRASPPASKRVASAPESKTSEQVGSLPIISEESDASGSQQRSATAPVPRNLKPADKTIRIVPASPADTVAPLNLRKSYTPSEASSDLRPRLVVHTAREPGERAGALSSIEEDTTLASTPTAVRKKRSAWFGLSKRGGDADGAKSPSQPSTPPAVQEVDGKPPRRLSKPAPTERPVADDPPPSAQSSEFPFRKKKKGFSRWLSRKDADQSQADDSTLVSNNNNNNNNTRTTNLSMDSLFPPASPAPSTDDAPPSSAGPERSWFARFFHTKPASRIICFNLPRGRARQELVVLLREWQAHGMRDVQWSRETNTISARVDRHNALALKPVAFRIELFVVLEHGRRVGMSIARFVQVKGAASAFRKTVDVVDGVMRARRCLVEDEEKWRALCDVVGGC